MGKASGGAAWQCRQQVLSEPGVGPCLHTLPAVSESWQSLWLIPICGCSQVADQLHGPSLAGGKVLLDMTFDEIIEHLNRQQASRGGPLEGASGFEGDDREGLETPFRSVVSGNMAVSPPCHQSAQLGLVKTCHYEVNTPICQQWLAHWTAQDEWLTIMRKLSSTLTCKAAIPAAASNGRPWMSELSGACAASR